MNARNEEAAVRRAMTLADARRLCAEWGYWCSYGAWGDAAGRKPFAAGAMGGPERRYKSPQPWNPPEPRFPEANEISGMAVQKAYMRLPERPYRIILRAEYCFRPWIVPLKEGEVESLIARRARVSIGSYDITLERALLALANVMKRNGLWRECGLSVG